MDAREFIELLENPDKVGKKSVEELKKLSLEHPYSQPVQLLYTMRLSQSSEYLFNRQLGKTSILTDDRSVLFDLFEREDEELEMKREETRSPSDEDLLEAHLTHNVKRAETQDAEPEASGEKNLPSETEQREEEAGASADESALVAEKEEEHLEESVSLEEEGEKPEEPFREDKPGAQADKPAPQREQPTEKPAKEGDQKLSASERVKAILEENRRLREEHERAKKQGEVSASSPVDERIAGIRDRLEKLRHKKEEERPEDLSAEPSEPKPVEKPEPEVSRPEETENLERTEQVNPGQQEEVSETSPESFEISPEEPVSEEREKPVEPEHTESQAAESSTEEEALLEQHQKGPEEELVDRVDEEEQWEAPADTVFTIEDEESGALQNEGEAGQEDALPAQDFPAEADIEEASGEEHSFSDWLKRLQGPVEQKTQASAGPSKEEAEQQEENPREPEDIDTKFQLLDSFVEKLPQLKKKQKNPPKPASRSEVDMRGLSEEESSLVTETLARVYVKQKHYEKAMKAYEILRLKYPEKSGFFADRISEIKKLINSK